MNWWISLHGWRATPTGRRFSSSGGGGKTRSRDGVMIPSCLYVFSLLFRKNAKLFAAQRSGPRGGGNECRIDLLSATNRRKRKSRRGESGSGAFELLVKAVFDVIINWWEKHDCGFVDIGTRRSLVWFSGN